MSCLLLHFQVSVRSTLLISFLLAFRTRLLSTPASINIFIHSKLLEVKKNPIFFCFHYNWKTFLIKTCQRNHLYQNLTVQKMYISYLTVTNLTQCFKICWELLVCFKMLAFPNDWQVYFVTMHGWMLCKWNESITSKNSMELNGWC
jgi:hypothetical protein